MAMEDETRRLDLSLQADPDNHALHFDIGVHLWDQGPESNEKAAKHFLISAKLNPHNAPAFKYLGDYYSTVSVDPQRALKCYERAVSLNPDDSHSGESLCELLDQAGKESVEMAVCKDAAGRSPKAFWAFRRLGFLQVHQRKWSEAVPSLQHAIRGFPTSSDLWEALGLAYHRLGMFTAAIKSYGRTIDLDDTRVFALVESGFIFVMIGLFRKGVEQFQQALNISPKNASAHYGLASGLLGQSKECINLGAFQWAASLLEEAAKMARACTLLAGNMSCIWKLHGDIQLTYAQCCPWMDKSPMSEYDVGVFKDSIVSWKETCRFTAVSARKSYQRALHLAPWQANIYTDIAVITDLISSFNKDHNHDKKDWQIQEKMALGALLLEGNNYEFWVALGNLSHHNALKQHAFIRGLQLDVSLAIAWSYLGKLYRGKNEKKLASQAFDCARSIDPSLALPWAGMSADINVRELASDDAFESCLRAVQILPLAEFQIGLAKIAILSGHLSSSQVFGAIQKAVQHAPQYPETHNLNGLIYEAHFQYKAAVYSYKLARQAINMSSGTVSKSNLQDISINLARSLMMAGCAIDAVQECEELKNEGMLDAEGLQIYAFSLWKLGKHEMALSVTRTLAAFVSTMDQKCAAASVTFICRLVYHISGLESAINHILKMPKELLQSPKTSFIVSAIHALDLSNRLQSVVSQSRYFLASHDEITGMHYLIALTKLIKHGSDHHIAFHSGIYHLRKALHMYPNSNLIRNLLGYLLLSTGDWKNTHVSTRCSIIDLSDNKNKEGLRSAWEILGSGAVACYVIGSNEPKFSFPTCSYQCMSGSSAIQQLQKCFHREPWDYTIRYLLTLNLFQKAREERFPMHLCNLLGRLIFVALSYQFDYGKENSLEYWKFQLFLCAAEISLQCGNLANSISHAKNVSELLLPDSYLFFGHLLLCRAYVAKGSFVNLKEEYDRCLELKTDFHVGWICLKVVGFQYGLQTGSNMIELSLERCTKEMNNSSTIWMAVSSFVQGLIYIWNQEYLLAEELLAQACSLAGDDSCLLLCHGATCMELARQYHETQFLSCAIRSLSKAQIASSIRIPIVSALLAQAEGSLGFKEKWRKNLHLEWFSWPPEMRSAELFFQMHLLARLLEDGADSLSVVECCQSPERFVLRAIHANPCSARYWKVLQKLTSCRGPLD